MPFGHHRVQDRSAQAGSVFGFLIKTDLIRVSARRRLRVLQHFFVDLFGLGFNFLINFRFGKRRWNRNANVKCTLAGRISVLLDDGLLYRFFDQFGRLQIEQHCVFKRLRHNSPVDNSTADVIG